jgi:pantetheine-phosphate adenylyltransferase
VNESIGLYPGSFDPVHLGHVDLVQRAARSCDRVVVAILDNSAKTSLFTVDERVAMLRGAFVDMPEVDVVTFRGLLVDFAKQQGAAVVFRGLRAVSDFEYEFQMAQMNRRLAGDVETLFLMASEDYTYLSSRLVKEVALLGGDVTGLVPPAVAEALEAKRRERDS